VPKIKNSFIYLINFINFILLINFIYQSKRYIRTRLHIPTFLKEDSPFLNGVIRTQRSIYELRALNVPVNRPVDHRSGCEQEPSGPNDVEPIYANQGNAVETLVDEPDDAEPIYANHEASETLTIENEFRHMFPEDPLLEQPVDRFEEEFDDIEPVYGNTGNTGDVQRVENEFKRLFTSETLYSNFEPIYDNL
jgi:hypothetical protein